MTEFDSTPSPVSRTARPREKPHRSRFRSDRLGRQLVERLLEASVLAGELTGLAVEDDLAIMDEKHPVGDRLDFLENMGRDQNGLRLAQVANQLPDSSNLIRDRARWSARP